MKFLRRIAMFAAMGLVQLIPAASNTVQAQSVDDTGAWIALLTRGDVGATERIKWWFDGHARFFDDTDGYGQSIVRPGLGYALSNSVTAWAGYGWIRTSPAARSDFDEHRVWQQLTGSTPVGLGTLGGRSRLEQRFLDTGSDTGWRFRQFVSFRRPLSDSSRFTFVVWDECFFHLNDTDWGADAGFNQNRIFVGFGRKCDVPGSGQIEIGYLHQYVRLPGRDDLSNHLLSINIFASP